MPSILHDVFCMYAHLLLWELQNYNSLLNSHWQENVGSYQGKIPHVQGQRKSLSKVVGGAKSCLESNPIPARDARRVQTNLVCTRTQRLHRDWARTVFECLLWRYCWSLAWRILSITLLVCEMSAIVQSFEHSLALPFFGIGMKTDLFQSRVHC